MSIKYKLKEPFQFGDEHVEELDLNEPKTKHLKELPLQTSSWKFSDMITLVSNVSAQPVPKIQELSINDLTGIMEELSPFLGDSQETGDS